VLQLQPLADLAEIQFDLDVPWGLPTILGHREQLIQVLVSMLGTALRRSDAGQSVTLRASSIEPDPESRDSDPFFPPSERELNGTDDVEIEVSYQPGSDEVEALDELGLAITREIIEHHGGSWASTSEADSQCFVAVFPALVPRS
jgi:signal transduction histidine kinase